LQDKPVTLEELHMLVLEAVKRMSPEQKAEARRQLYQKQGVRPKS